MSVVSPIDYVGLRTALISTIRAATGLGQNQVVMAEPEAPGGIRPLRPFVTLKVTNAAMAFGYDSIESIPNTPNFKVSGPRRINVDVNAIGNSHEDAYSIMALLQATFRQHIMLDILTLAGVTVWDTGPVNDLSFLMSTGYEGRAQMELMLCMTSSMTVNIGQISSVNALGNINAPPVQQIQFHVQGT